MRNTKPDWTIVIKNFINWIVLIFGGLVSLFLLMDGQALYMTIIDRWQKTICTNHICIYKPKGWMPLYVTKHNTLYVVGIIDSKYIPGFDLHTIDKTLNSIRLINGKNEESTIDIMEINGTLKDGYLKHFKSYTFNKRKYFYCTTKDKRYYRIVDENKSMILLMNDFDPKIIENIIYGENKNARVKEK